MGRGFYDSLRAVLVAHACHFVRQARGSHEIWFSPLSQKRFSVPVTVVAKPTANAILRQAGIHQRL
ncbi:type II toxin-antitoxin system HicA family toxin [Verminephrobacter aporrectodeae subsp. tuberculatae]|uniref:Type II toxin-antitoxin system HicA family toxin n=1 Tax=Verminephrobacter aporrectodeae subsp. tuberculatae TaxID=1110392 RepID=A0ABT3KTK5_9BURK|nr:type II toxin-antitoxin system HicA family toxin [Verminephrobacter aporrectodeae subsp. tuberculatae]MCW5257373.1 type II toxin-antitoxin system HicA family toxin [Verminephrobacter aporrectodeae subsp. tuberculatae]MCW5287886.1 type II toxin-antitoxin system HicA family toxin [Verminephrobacter aporrectodeae subsp. tuberculatae]MCW5321442.1 type II toxin-antitoxin system HicA family toxin [Verminephrobacter aporrectodeae subsp. tuberculatae]MCW8166785.1 type II toxin-antitoxin system HicA 